MSTLIDFIDVGQGNMTLLRLSDGRAFLYDCNVTDDNEDYVLQYLRNALGSQTSINVFINSHRDADHMRGVKKVHADIGINAIWDSGVVGTTPTSTEYREYMALRRLVGSREVQKNTKYDYGRTRLRILNSKNDNLPDNANAQSIVVKVEHLNLSGGAMSSTMLTGDSDAATWKDIRRRYSDADLASSILLASHHGSITFFDDPSDSQYYYSEHISAINPAMTIISVGADNPHGHPDGKALELYEKYSTGSNKGNKIKRTDEHGSWCLELGDTGSWTFNQR